MPECFIIMPITTPDSLISQYGSDGDHFKHVLEHLFIPAVEKAGFSPIPPVASGSDLIHAEIIKNLERSDLVLCDISTLNPNVFFELGIRTAVDKPVCLVRDEFTERIPFDTGILNFLSYDPFLSLWKLDNQITSLADHITKSLNRSQERNTLWKYFGLTTRAELKHPDSPVDEKINLILSKMDSLEQFQSHIVSIASPIRGTVEENLRRFSKEIAEIAIKYSAILDRISFDKSKNLIVVDLEDFLLPEQSISEMMELGGKYGFSVKFSTKKPIMIERLKNSRLEFKVR